MSRDHIRTVRDIHQTIVQSALRREHAALVRAVRRLNKEITNSFINCDEINAYRLACEDVLALLAARKGGK